MISVRYYSSMVYASPSPRGSKAAAWLYYKYRPLPTKIPPTTSIVYTADYETILTKLVLKRDIPIKARTFIGNDFHGDVIIHVFENAVEVNIPSKNICESFTK